ncbi:hypothetical protein C8A01DRAFT_31194 [Parachaetomium inaequale]|uniref:UspA domain-containing protein n=1 Tax=Parachaetomium inaequale TaxID=2588326 RepID=A0AAN6PU86_9PEZI|nr:hypothetical protein C8A01DRAFT_31194 [Parachaetomium inaequale]
MATTIDHVDRLASPPSAAKSPDSDVSPGTIVPSVTTDYFSAESGANGDSRPNGAYRPFASASTDASTTTLASISEEGQVDSSRQTSNDSSRPSVGHRKSSAASVTFRPPRNPSLPQGHPRKTDNRRLRESSPSPVRFEQHVGFDNLPVGEATKNNPSSFTLQARHQGYQLSRRSRTFMIGVDEHNYSQYALVWLLNNMVDDGDEVICVRVMESPVRPDKNYQEDARKLMELIKSKNDLNKAICIILEYSVGKLHDTFQQLLGIYNPSMLVVGTKGRTLGGFQGLMNARNSFSKYCLQYSPIPVVVVRPDDKRLKKKEKRSQDPTRQSYAAMLAYNSGRHEADSEASSVYEFEKGISADEEAHRVAAAIGLPARFDPTIKPYTPRDAPRRRSSPSRASERTTSISPPPTPLAVDSGEEDSGDDDEFEVEAVSGQQLAAGARKQQSGLEEQKERLHAMEVGEAAALLKSGKAEELEDDDDDDESQERVLEVASKS